MDTAKAVGIIIANPEFEDVRSLGGVADTKKTMCTNHCRGCQQLQVPQQK